MRRCSRQWILTAVAVTMLTGCAAFSEPAAVEWRAGWRTGTIVAIRETGTSEGNWLRHCPITPQAAAAGVKEATVQHVRMGRKTWWRGPLPNDSSLKVNDAVRFNVRGCELPMALVGDHRTMHGQQQGK